MQHSNSINCSQYQSKNAPQYYNYLLPGSVYTYNRVLQSSVVSISLQMHLSTAIICCQDQSINTTEYFSHL